MKPNAQPPDPFDILLAQLSEFFCSVIIGSYLDIIRMWHREHRSFEWIVEHID